MILTIVIFILILGLLIFVHEAGHFFIAKKTGVKVEEFAFGFPPKIISWKRGGTRYSINLIPLGGYVKLLGEEEDVKKPGSYYSKPIGIKIAVIVAGGGMNYF